MTNDSRILIRHILATLAYRAAKPLRDAPEAFGSFRASDTTRTPAQVLAHMGDLLDWALTQVTGAERWQPADPLPWPDESARFFAALGRLDQALAADAADGVPEVTLLRLFQGPIADAFTHVGQLTMLRRQFGAPIRGENYHRADIVTGRVGATQAAPQREFN
jgi:hypothetical protein